jgi:hypothetical protein
MSEQLAGVDRSCEFALTVQGPTFAATQDPVF